MQYRDTSRGDVKDLQLSIRELNQQLRDRKQTCVVLKAELQRLKTANASLQERLGEKEMSVGGLCRRGEALSMGALRQAALAAKGKEGAAHEQLLQAMDHIDQLRCQVDMAQGELAETKDLLQSAQENCSRGELEIRGCRDTIAVLQATVKELQAQAQAHKQDAEQTRKALTETEGWLHQTQDECTQRMQQLQSQRGESAQALEQCRQDHEQQMAAQLQALEAQLSSQAHKQQAALKQALADKEAALQSLQQQVGEALEAWQAIPPALTLIEPSGGGGTRKLTDAGGAEAAAAAVTVQGACMDGGHGIQLVLHEAALLEAVPTPALPPGHPETLQQPQQQQQQQLLTGRSAEARGSRAGSAQGSRVLLLQLGAPGVLHPYRRLLRFDARAPGAGGRGGAAAAPHGHDGAVTLALDTLLQIEGQGEGGEQGQAKARAGAAADEEARAQRLLQLLREHAEFCVHDMAHALLGGFNCPAPPGHPKGVGQLLPVAAYALPLDPSAPGITAVELFECGAPTQGAQQQAQQQQGQGQQARSEPGLEPQAWLCTLSADWRHVLPKDTPAPGPEEFVVDLSAQHPLILEAARASGLFGVGLPFTGTDQHKYQVWSLQPQQPRALSTAKYLAHKDIQVAPRLAEAAQPLATATLPLMHALTSPDAASASARAVHALLRRAAQPLATAGGPVHGQPGAAPPPSSRAALQGQANSGASEVGRLGAYSPSPAQHNTQRVTLHAPAAAGGGGADSSRAVLELSVTTRLQRPLCLPPAVLVAATAPPAAPTPAEPTPRAGLLVGDAARLEEVVARQVETGQQAGRLHAVVYGACVAIVGLQAGRDGQLVGREEETWQQAHQEAEGAIADLGTKLEASLRATHQAALAAAEGNMGDAELASSIAASTSSHVGRCLAQSLLLLHAVRTLTHFASMLRPLAGAHPRPLLPLPMGTPGIAPPAFAATTAAAAAAAAAGHTSTATGAPMDASTPPGLHTLQQRLLGGLAARLVALQQRLAEGGAAAWAGAASPDPHILQQQQGLPGLQPVAHAEQDAGLRTHALLLPPPLLARAAMDVLQPGCGMLPHGPWPEGRSSHGLKHAGAAAGPPQPHEPSGSRGKAVDGGSATPEPLGGAQEQQGGSSGGLQLVWPPRHVSYEDASDALFSRLQVALEKAAADTARTVAELRCGLGPGAAGGASSLGLDLHTGSGGAAAGAAAAGTWDAEGRRGAALEALQGGVARALGQVTAVLIQQLAQVLPTIAAHAPGEVSLAAAAPPGGPVPGGGGSVAPSGRMLLSRLLVRLQAELARLLKGDPWGLPPPPPSVAALPPAAPAGHPAHHTIGVGPSAHSSGSVAGGAAAWVRAAAVVSRQLQAASTYHTGLVALAGSHVLLCCGRRHEAVAAVLEAGSDEAQRALGVAQAQLRLVCPGQTYGSAELQADASRSLLDTLPGALAAAALLGHDLALQLLLVPLLARQRDAAQQQRQQHFAGSVPASAPQPPSGAPSVWCGASVASCVLRCQELWPVSLAPVLDATASGGDSSGDGHGAGAALQQQQQNQNQEQQPLLQPQPPAHQEQVQQLLQAAVPWSWASWPCHRVLLVVASDDEQPGAGHTGLGGGAPQALAQAAVAAAAAALGWGCMGLEEQLGLVRQRRQQGQQQQQQQPLAEGVARALSEREAVAAIARGVDAAVLLGHAGSVPKWLAQQQVVLLPAYEEQDPALLRALRAAGKAVAKQHASRGAAPAVPPGADRGQAGDSTATVGGRSRGASRDGGRMGGLPQPSAHLPGTDIAEPVAELARQLVARVGAAHMQRGAAAVAVAVAATAGQAGDARQPGGSAGQEGMPPAAQLPAEEPVRQQQQQQHALQGWHCVLSTLYEDAALAARAGPLITASRTHVTKLAALLEGLQRSLQPWAGHQQLPEVAALVKDTTAVLGQRQLLLEGLLLASKQGAVVRSMLLAGKPSTPRPSQTSLPHSSRASPAVLSRSSSMRGLPLRPTQLQRRGADSTDSEDEEVGVIKGVQRQARGNADLDRESDVASLRTVSSASTASYRGGMNGR